MTKSQFLAKIDVAMGGRAAEEIVFGKDKVTAKPLSEKRKTDLFRTQQKHDNAQVRLK